MQRSLVVTVIIATYNRAPTLAGTLKLLAEQRPGVAWEVLIVDNGSTDRTAQVAGEMCGRMPLRFLRVPEVSKAQALNLALGNVRSKWIVFTDDDVSPRANWLTEIIRGFDVGDFGAVCGPIVPAFPDSTPRWLRSHAYAAFAFGSFRPFIREGDLPPGLLPFGANFGASLRNVRDLRFREDLGPDKEHPWRTGEDTDFILRLRERSGGITYMPRAILSHNIKPESVDATRIFERAFNVGRSCVILDGRVRSADELGPVGVSANAEVREFELGVQANFYYGQLCQLYLRGDHHLIPTVYDFLTALPGPRSPHLLSRSASQFLADISGECSERIVLHA